MAQLPPGQAEAAAITGNYQWNVETWRLANKTTWDIDADSSLSLGFSYETQQLYHPIVQSPFFSLLIDTEQRNFGTSLRYNLRRGAHDLLAGLNYGRTARVAVRSIGRSRALARRAGMRHRGSCCDNKLKRRSSRLRMPGSWRFSSVCVSHY